MRKFVLVWVIGSILILAFIGNVAMSSSDVPLPTYFSSSSMTKGILLLRRLVSVW